MKTYIVLHTDGTMTVKNDEGDLSDITQSIGSEYIQSIPTNIEGIVVYGDEEGLLNNKDHNASADIITGHMHSLGVRGDVAVFGDDGGDDEISLTSEEISSIALLTGATVRE